MKKHHTISLILLALLLAVGFTILTHNFPFPGKTSDDFSLITGSSQTYTPEEIQDAADAVLHYFKGFSGATMTKLQYVASSSEEDNWAEKDGMEQGIHFVSDFTTGDLPNKCLTDTIPIYPYARICSMLSASLLMDVICFHHCF